MEKHEVSRDPKTEPLDVVLFHSTLGLRPGVLAWAERLRGAGYRVHTPDLYDGEVFESIEASEAKVQAIGGVPGLMSRTMELAKALPANAVYAGFSNGAGSAELLALSRPGALGVILMHGALPVEVFGATVWPAGVPAQVHYSAGDPFRDSAGVAALGAAVRDSTSRFEFFEYPGDGHLFADPGLPEYDHQMAQLMFDRVLEFLVRCREHHSLQH